jgi:hypothetical protein
VGVGAADGAAVAGPTVVVGIGGAGDAVAVGPTPASLGATVAPHAETRATARIRRGHRGTRGRRGMMPAFRSMLDAGPSVGPLDTSDGSNMAM